MFSRKRALLNPYRPASPPAVSSRDVRELTEAVERNTDLLMDLLITAGLGVLVVIDYLMGRS